MDDLTGPTIATIKRLFATSGNQCAFPKCTSTLVDGKKVVGKICHIKARSEGGSRFDPNQTPEERHGYDNLILMCGRHHDVIDDDEEAYTVEYLHRLKTKHEQNSVRLPEDEAEQGANMLVLNQSASSINQSGGISAHTVNINNYSSSKPSIEPAKNQEEYTRKIPVQTKTIASPKLKIARGTERVIFDYRRSSWRLADQWEPESLTALVLWVENEFPLQGSARDMSGLIASIRAEQYDSFTVSRAYWLEQRFNEVTIRSGGRLGVLIGHFSGNESFISYCNPNPEPLFDHILDDGFRSLVEKAKLNLIRRDSETMPLHITIVIAQMPAQTVIACKRLIITLPHLIVDMQECG